MVICKKCGVDSPNENWCLGCGFPLNDEARRIAKLSREMREKKEKEIIWRRGKK